MESTGKLVKIGLKSIAASFPGFATIAQAWNEAETERRNTRIDRFFIRLRQDMLRVEERIIAIEKNLKLRPDIALLMERTVEKIKREASEEKIARYSLLLANTIAGEASVTYDAGVNFIEVLDILTDHDIEVLGNFKQCRNIRVDSLVQGGGLNWAPIGQAQPGGVNLSTMSWMIVSLLKLQNLALIAESVEAGGAYCSSGDPQHWYNRWRLKSFELLPFGQTFMQMIEKGSTQQGG